MSHGNNDNGNGNGTGNGNGNGNGIGNADDVWELCDVCDIWLVKGMVVWAPMTQSSEELFHCKGCHTVWDGCAQCPCAGVESSSQ